MMDLLQAQFLLAELPVSSSKIPVALVWLCHSSGTRLKHFVWDITETASKEMFEILIGSC